MQNEKPYVEWMGSSVQYSPQQNAHRSMGWFLKSVLVVAGVVVTALILFPVFAVPHMHSGPSCISHIRTLGIGLQMYQEDYDGCFPRAATWMDATLPYEKNTQVYRCPNLDMPHPTDFGYAFNATLTLQKREQYKTPEKVVMLYDANDLRWNANAPGRAGMANPPRHQGRNNVGFADGHVKWQSVTGKDR